MNGFNKTILAGNLTKDPEMRFLPNGTAIASFGLAINRKFKDASGQQKEDVVFCDITAFGKQAEAIGQYLKKGRPILLEGRLKTDSWEDKQTKQKRSKLGVVLESFTFLDSGKTEGGGEQRPASAPAAATAPAAAGSQPEEDDVPF